MEKVKLELIPLNTFERWAEELRIEKSNFERVLKLQPDLSKKERSRQMKEFYVRQILGMLSPLSQKREDFSGYIKDLKKLEKKHPDLIDFWCAASVFYKSKYFMSEKRRKFYRNSLNFYLENTYG